MAIAPNRRSAAAVSHRGTGGTYSIHPLVSLDGVLLYVTLNGETVGSWFGATEELAASAFDRHLNGAASQHSAGKGA